MAEKYAVVATQRGVAEIASSLTDRSVAPSALDRVVAGVLGAAALHPAVLLGSVQILTGGAGSGLRFVDGRPRQPGNGIPRPRGFLAGEAIPKGAYAAASRVPSALAAAIALDRAGALSSVVGPALEAVRAISSERAKILDLLARRGGETFADEGVAEELVVVGGRLEGGALTAEDLRGAAADVVDPRIVTRGAIGFAVAPWIVDEDAARGGGSTEIIAAADLRGRFAIAAYEAPADGVDVAALGLRFAPLAIPVMRGQPRVRPGTVLDASSPILIAVRAGIVEAAVGIARGPLSRAFEIVSSIASSALEHAVRAPGEGRAIAVARAGDTVVASIGMG